MVRLAFFLLLLPFAIANPARAERTEAERTARWADLRHAIFGDRLVTEFWLGFQDQTGPSTFFNINNCRSTGS